MTSIALTETSQATTEYIAAEDGASIPVRVYGAKNMSTPVILSHGLQSHSGWFVRSCSFLAENGFPVYAPDRRGSGLSTESRGDAKNFRDMIADIHTVAEYATSTRDDKRVHVFGHSLGAIISAAFGAAHPERVKSLILATPGFYSKNDVTLRQKLQVFGSTASGKNRRFPSLLKPEVFSELDEYIAFIRDDELALKSVTSSLLWQIVQMRRFVNQHRNKLAMPALMLCAGHDEVCDTPRNHRFWEELPTTKKEYIEYENTRHVIEFGPQREQFFKDLLRWLQWLEESN